jgi:uncharacterized protein (DUF362 family)
MDSVETFASESPPRGHLVSQKVMFEDIDHVAIDVVSVALLWFFKTTSVVANGSIFKQEQLVQVVGLGLGVDSLHKIKLVTCDSQSASFAE